MTPMLRQYFQIKEQYPDTNLFFRMGVFTRCSSKMPKLPPHPGGGPDQRDKKKERRHSSLRHSPPRRDLYAAKLLRAGHKIAICEQVEDPALSKGLVKRRSPTFYTPGTALKLETESPNRKLQSVRYFSIPSNCPSPVSTCHSPPLKSLPVPVGSEEDFKIRPVQTIPAGASFPESQRESVEPFSHL
jgi:DNA mismatch repair ATPase MutS